MSVLTKLGKILVKNSPKICVGIGVVGVGAGVYLACKDSINNTDELEQIKVDLCEKDYIPAAKRFGKVYWPSVLVIGGSLVVIICGHRIISKRYAGLLVAYESLNQTYKNYRGYIRKNYGDDLDFNARQFDNGLSMTDHEVFINDDIFIPDRDLSDFAVFYGRDYSENIETDNPEEAFSKVKAAEELANAIFEERGYIFMQEVYDILGIDKFAPDGVGWCHGIGDNYVDFGIYSVKNGRAVNGNEPVFLLDFNHDGYILNHI